MISSRLKSVRSLSDDVQRCIDRDRLDKALLLIHDFVERIITEPLCTSQLAGSRTLDDLCGRIGKLTLDTLQAEGEPHRCDSSSPVYAYIATKLYKSGGHTRVVQDFITAKPGARHVVLLTGLEGKSDLEYLRRQFDAPCKVEFEQSPQRNYRECLVWLQRRLIELSPTKTFLFNHHQDSVAAAAIQPQMGLDAAFYHHGDHHLSLGVFLSHLKHIDPHATGYHQCRGELGIDNTFIPLTFTDRGERPPSRPFLPTGRLTTCTAARANKVEIPYFVSYLDVIPKLLKATGGRHVHIGKLSASGVSRIRRGLAREGISPDRLLYLPWTASVWKSLHEHEIDLYVASFPYGGGLTLVEAMGAGIPVALHNHIFSRVLSCVDLAYPEAFIWRQPEELLQHCANVTATDLQRESELARKHYERFHSADFLQQYLNDPVAPRLTPPPASDRFSVNTEEWSLWMEQQLNCRNLLYRSAYRAYRKLRARWL